MNKIYNVEGMGCSACSTKIENNLKVINGLSNVSVDLDKKTLTLDIDESQINESQIISLVDDLGYEIKL